MADRFIKNTYEILSPLHEITAEKVMTMHEFLTPDYKVEHVIFGEDTDVVVNKASGGVTGGCASGAGYLHVSRLGGDVLLPPFGLAIESPTFVAFHALSWDGIKYEKPALFTIRSLDGKSISESGRIRVFHGFGGKELMLRENRWTIPKETILSFCR